MNLARLLDDAAAKHASRPAIAYEGSTVDFAELRGLSAAFAGLLRAHGVEPGDRVAILLPNMPAFVGAYYGALRLGAIAVPLNALLKNAEIEQRLADSEPRVLVALEERAAELQEVVDRHGVTLLEPSAAGAAALVYEIVDCDPNEPAVLLYTSGTTGGPKGAELTHAGLQWVANYTSGSVLGLTPEDVVYGALPLAHIFAQSAGMNASIAGGACLRLVPRFEANAALEMMAQAGSVVFLGVPTMCIALVQAAESAPSVPRLRIAHVGGAAVPVETLREFEARFECEVLEGWGMTETAGIVVTHHHGQAIKPGSVGTPVEGAQARIAEIEAGSGIGEVLVRGHGLMRGYWRNPVASAEALDAEGWFASGDVGYLDDDGYLFLVDRMKDTILRGGYNVYPREVEEILYEHPSVLEAAVIGVPDARLGEEIVALVVARPGAACDPEALKQFVRERIAAYKYPRLVLVVADLPRGPSGKILKREIDREQLQQALAAASQPE